MNLLFSVILSIELLSWDELELSWGWISEFLEYEKEKFDWKRDEEDDEDVVGFVKVEVVGAWSWIGCCGRDREWDRVGLRLRLGLRLGLRFKLRLGGGWEDWSEWEWEWAWVWELDVDNGINSSLWKLLLCSWLFKFNRELKLGNVDEINSLKGGNLTDVFGNIGSEGFVWEWVRVWEGWEGCVWEVNKTWLPILIG